MFWFRRSIHRDHAAAMFIKHCEAEANRLKSALTPHLSLICSASENLDVAEVLARPLITFKQQQFAPSPRSLIEAHCFAMVAATGLRSIHKVSLSGQGSVLEWLAHKQIVIGDVGAENLGKALNSRPQPGMCVTYAPGTFDGTPSQVQALVRRYGKYENPLDKLTLLCLGLRLIRPIDGVCREVYKEIPLAAGWVGTDIVGYASIDADEADEWQDDLRINDASAALAEVRDDTKHAMATEIEGIDRFWPTFDRRHKVVW